MDIVLYGLPPPPKGKTFEVVPGGVCVLASKDCVLKKISSPEIHQWESIGRALAVRLTIGSYNLVIAGVYGFAPSHARHEQNDSMIASVGAWLSSLNCPVILAGDMNETVSSSPFVSLSHNIGLWRLSGDGPSTRAQVWCTLLVVAN